MTKTEEVLKDCVSVILDDCQRLCLRDGNLPSRRTCQNCKKWAVLEEAKNLLKEVITK